MYWECSECGERVVRRNAPFVCRGCGTAGPIFVAAERGLEEADDSDDLRDAWVRIGVMRASASRRSAFASGDHGVGSARS
jgi:hypothetical protein